jgi:hypothetical protein
MGCYSSSFESHSGQNTINVSISLKMYSFAFCECLHMPRDHSLSSNESNPSIAVPMITRIAVRLVEIPTGTWVYSNLRHFITRRTELMQLGNSKCLTRRSNPNLHGLVETNSAMSTAEAPNYERLSNTVCFIYDNDESLGRVSDQEVSRKFHSSSARCRRTDKSVSIGTWSRLRLITHEPSKYLSWEYHLRPVDRTTREHWGGAFTFWTLVPKYDPISDNHSRYEKGVKKTEKGLNRKLNRSRSRIHQILGGTSISRDGRGQSFHYYVSRSRSMCAR